MITIMSTFTLNLPKSDAHKTQNGKLLIIGGSSLFHAASLWSAAVAAHLVDMVFYASTSENNDLIKIAKNGFRDGIVIERDQLTTYAKQADVILLGPGMMRGDISRDKLQTIIKDYPQLDTQALSEQEWRDDTYLITNYLLATLRDKKFVLDAGALQMVEPSLLTPSCLLTPHQLEYEGLLGRCQNDNDRQKVEQTTILKKAIVDELWQGGQLLEQITGGNAGLTKGGSGDVLAGVAAGLYCYNDAAVAAYWASKSIKAAAEKLFTTTGPFFTTTQLGQLVPETLWNLVNG